MNEFKKSKPKSLLKTLILFLIGGLCYYNIEILFRGYSFLSMALVGGLCFVLIGELNETYPWDMPLICQQFLSMFIVTIIEFIAGVVLNICLKQNVWDYSNMPYNLFGQICLLFSIGWFFLSLVAIFLDDLIRWKLFHEEKPHYCIFYPNGGYSDILEVKKDGRDKGGQ